MTSAGKQSLEDELKRLVGQIQQELDASLVSAQKIFADTGDDSDLNIAKDRQNFNNFRIGELKERCSKAEVIDDSKVSFNSDLKSC
jgi:transcription elongation factor GreA